MEKEEIDAIQNQLNNDITKHTSVILVVAFFSCQVTLMIILVLSYKISMSISKPLTSLIKIADVINDNATEKNIINNLDDDIKNLPEVLFLKDLEIIFIGRISIERVGSGF